MRGITPWQLGISAIAVYEPSWLLPNDWFGDEMPRKFVRHTGIESRPISQEDEVTMAVRAAERLQEETGCDWDDCAGAIFVSPSFIPMAVARRYLDKRHQQEELLSRAASRFARQMGIRAESVTAINWFCSGYPKAISLAARQAPRLDRDQFLLVVTSSRISRITDYGCAQTAPLFGDMATATLLSRSDSEKYPSAFHVLYAHAEMQAASGVFFDFHCGERVLVPDVDGGRRYEWNRIVFTLDGLGIADTAPRAMTSAVEQALRTSGREPEEVRFVIPHQAGTGIVRLAAMKLDDIHVRGEVINGLTKRVGNVSSCSIPYALQRSWTRLEGLIACPSAAVGLPGKAAVSQGCILLQAADNFHAASASPDSYHSSLCAPRVA